jgi:hypothetical protein
MSLSGVKLDLSQLTIEIGVYVLCDLDEVPIYVGQTVSIGERGIRGRVRRHLTSARSDAIANRQMDVWEIAWVWAWPIAKSEEISRFEASIFSYFKKKNTLVAGKHLRATESFDKLPEYQRVQILESQEIAKRRDLRFRLPRQLQQINQLLDVMLNVKDSEDLRFSLDVHFQRLQNLYKGFLTAEVPDAEM